MRRDLLDALRCPADHEESWLVAVVHTAEGPSIIDADLACPICRAEYPVRAGVAYFGVSPLGAPWAATPVVSASVASVASVASSPDPVRVAALLGVTEGPTPLLLAGSYAAVGAGVHALGPTPQLWINSATVPANAEHSLLRVSTRVPLGAGTVSAAAVDLAHADDVMLDSIVRSVRQGGRILAPVTVLLPPRLQPSVRELARDAVEWVAEVTRPPSGLVTLRRQPSE